MDSLKLPRSLDLVWDIKRSIESGVSVNVSLQSFLRKSADDEFHRKIQIWLQIPKIEKNEYMNSNFNSHQIAILRTIDMGLNGASIYEQLQSLEGEIIEMCESDIQEHVAKLPIIMQIPLLFLVFPAICILLIIPALAQLSL